MRALHNRPVCRSVAARAALGAVAVLVGLVPLALPSGALARTSTGPALSWSQPVLLDRFPPIAHTAVIEAVQCPSVHLCVASDESGDLLTSTDPTTGSWDIIPGQPVAGSNGDLSCPSVDLCVAGDANNGLLVSTDPAGGAQAWRAVQPLGDHYIQAVSCSSSNFCIAVDGAGNVLSSTDPAGGPSAWQEQTSVFPSNASPGSVSCPSANFCAATAFSTVYTSENPAGGPAAWHSRVITASKYGVGPISCSSADLCVTFDGRYVFTSTSPSTGSWTSTLLNNAADNANGVWCDSSGRCVTSDISGATFVSSNPSGGADAWTRTDVGDRGLSDVACPVSNLCVASTFRGQMLTTSNPALGQWSIAFIDGGNYLTDVSCPASRLCLAVDDAGHVLFSRDPTGGVRTWRAHNLQPATRAGFRTDLRSISCPSTTVCMVLDASGGLISSSHPTKGPGEWRFVRLGRSGVTAFDCPSVRRCFAVDASGHLWTTMHPLAGARAWRRSLIRAHGAYNRARVLTGVGCFGVRLCVVGDVDGGVLVSNRPTRPGSTWRYTPGVGSGGKSGVYWGVSCPSLSLCVLSDGYDVYATSDPSADHWKYQLGSGYSSSGYTSTALASCVSAHLCFSYGNNENLLYTSTRPAGGPSAWTPSNIPAGIGSIGCDPSVSLCVGTSAASILIAR